MVFSDALIVLGIFIILIFVIYAKLKKKQSPLVLAIEDIFKGEKKKILSPEDIKQQLWKEKSSQI